MPLEIQNQPSPTVRNGSLDMGQPEMTRIYHKCVLIVKKINFEKLGFHQMVKLDILSMKSKLENQCVVAS